MVEDAGGEVAAEVSVNDHGDGTAASGVGRAGHHEESAQHYNASHATLYLYIGSGVRGYEGCRQNPTILPTKKAPTTVGSM